MAEKSVNNTINKTNNDKNNEEYEFDNGLLPVVEIKDEYIEYIDEACNTDKVRVKGVSEINESVSAKNNDERININVVTIPERKRKYAMQSNSLSKEEDYQLTIEFIKTIEQHECLWKASSKGQNHKQRKIYYWKVIGDKFDITGRDAYHKFVKLRKTYSDEDFKQIKSKQPSTWSYMKYLKFLDVNKDNVTQRINCNNSMEASENEDEGNPIPKIMRPYSPNDLIQHMPNVFTKENPTTKNTAEVKLIKKKSDFGPIDTNNDPKENKSDLERMKNSTQKSNHNFPAMQANLKSINTFNTQKNLDMGQSERFSRQHFSADDLKLPKRNLKLSSKSMEIINSMQSRENYSQGKLNTGVEPANNLQTSKPQHNIMSTEVKLSNILNMQITKNNPQDILNTDSEPRKLTINSCSGNDTITTAKLKNTSNTTSSSHNDVLEFVQKTFQRLQPAAAKLFEKELMFLAMEFRYNK